MIRRLAGDNITGVSINKMSNQSVYIQWADANPTVPEFRVRLWYNGNIRVDQLLSGQDAANDYYIWYVDCCTYALMPSDIIKAEVTPYANGQAIASPYSATATIQAAPATSPEPTQVVQTTPQAAPLPSSSSGTPAVPSPQPVTPAPTPSPNQYVQSPSADTTTGAQTPAPMMFSALGWIKNHIVLTAGLIVGAGFAIHGARKK